MTQFEGKSVLVTGGTGSFGKTLVRRLLSGVSGTPERVVVLSRDEAKQHDMRLGFQQIGTATDEVIFENFRRVLQFRIGDVRDYASISTALRGIDTVVNAAALKQVPACEYFPEEAVRTNVLGACNLVRAVREHGSSVQTVVGVSTDKACKPINVMGMTKALQERVFIQANLDCPDVRFLCVRYGNVLASRGSVIPLFHAQITAGGPVTITTTDMTRFLLTLDQAVDTVFAAIGNGDRGETWIPRVPSARVVDLAAALVGDRPIETRVIGIRPGEKIHEILVSAPEAPLTIEKAGYYVIRPMLPELGERPPAGTLTDEYSSRDSLLTGDGLADLLRTHRLYLEDVRPDGDELLR